MVCFDVPQMRRFIQGEPEQRRDKALPGRDADVIAQTEAAQKSAFGLLNKLFA